MDGSAGVRMKFWRAARLLGVLILGLICVSCGDQYRPVAIPIVAAATQSPERSLRSGV